MRFLNIYINIICEIVLKRFRFFVLSYMILSIPIKYKIAQSAGAVEYTDCFSAEW